MNAFTFRKLREKNYFEGYYVRFYDAEDNVNLAFIFAVTYNEEDPHAFLQVFDGIKRENTYHRYPLSDFDFEEERLTLGPNTLTSEHLSIDTPNHKLDIRFRRKVLPPKKSAMGFLKKLPLQCYQEVLLLDGEADATTHERRNFSGKIYMEKTYGRAFPKRWLWVQANNFTDASVALSLAGGSVPFLMFRPFGFFVLLKHGDRTYRFASYNASRIKTSQNGDTMMVTVRKGRYRLDIRITPSKPTRLSGPADKGKMGRDVYETLDANLHIALKKKSTILLKDKAACAALEWML